MAAPPGFAQLVTDDFNRANQNPIAGNWTNGTGVGDDAMAISANTYVNGATGIGDSVAHWTSWSGNDQYSQAEITAGAASAGAGYGVCVRKSTTASVKTYYRAVVDNAGNIVVGKLLTGTFSSLRTDTVSYAAARKLGLSATGSNPTTLKVWYNGVQIGADITDSTSPITSGNPGIAYSSTLFTSSFGDNWDAGTLAVGAGKLALKPWPFKPAFVQRR